MALVRWNPWNLSSILDEEIDLPTFPGLSRFGQGLNIYETEDSIVAEAALPGIKEDQVDITVEDSIVRITARVLENQQEKNKRRYFMSSMAENYNYSFRLPEGIQTDTEPKAELSNGVLQISFSKIKKEPPKKVKVFATATKS